MNEIETRNDETKNSILQAIAEIKRHLTAERETNENLLAKMKTIEEERSQFAADIKKMRKELESSIQENLQLQAEVLRLVEESKVLNEILQALNDIVPTLKK